VTKYIKVLKPLKEATKRLEARGKQGKHSAIYKVIPIFKYVFRAYEAIVKLYCDVNFNAHAKSLEDYLAINL
jgi:hypothetical protein